MDDRSKILLDKGGGAATILEKNKIQRNGWSHVCCKIRIPHDVTTNAPINKNYAVKNNQRNCSTKKTGSRWTPLRSPVVPSPAAACKCHSVRLLSTPCSISATSKGCQGRKVRSGGRVSTQPQGPSHPLWTPSFRCWRKIDPLGDEARARSSEDWQPLPLLLVDGERWRSSAPQGGGDCTVMGSEENERRERGGCAGAWTHTRQGKGVR
jgi:hypothetical protein